MSWVSKIQSFIVNLPQGSILVKLTSVGMKTKTIATTLVKGAFAMKAIPIFIGVGVVVGGYYTYLYFSEDG
jgi:hypothetical protein